jgi:hypothetical protein
MMQFVKPGSAAALTHVLAKPTSFVARLRKLRPEISDHLQQRLLLWAFGMSVIGQRA